jgi:phosphoribosylformylglycinamidine (FGAM) synthase PurS component
MTTFNVEVVDRFEDSRPAREYVYSPVPEDCELRETRVYRIEGPDDTDRLETFVENTLVDPVSQTWSLEAGEHEPVLENFDSVIDVSLKADVLDLEAEYLMEYCEHAGDDSEFCVTGITIVTRYYLTADNPDGDLVDGVVRDLVNPVIHEWSVTSP